MTATVIDALVTTLGLDAGGLKKGANEADQSLKKIEQRTTKTSHEVERSSKVMAASFSSVKREIMGMLAALGVALSVKGLEGFFASMTKSDASIGRFAANVDLAASRVDAFRTVAKEFGESGEAALQALQSVSTGVSEAVMTGQSAFVNTARANGIVLRDANGHFLKTDQIMFNVGKRLRDIAAHNGPMGRQLAMNLAGRLGMGSYFNALMSSSFEGDVNQAQGLSGVTAAAVKQAEALQKQWALVGVEFTKLKNQIYLAFGPTLLKLSKDFEGWLSKVDFKKVADQAQRFIEGIPWDKFEAWLSSIQWKKSWDEVVSFIKSLEDLSTTLKNNLKPALEIIAGLLALKFISPVGKLIGLFAGPGSLAWAVGVAAAAFGGWKLGSWIESNLSVDHQDAIGRLVAQFLALAGDKTAQEALDTEYAAHAASGAQAAKAVGASTPIKYVNGRPVVDQGLAAKIDAQSKAGAFGKMTFSDIQTLRAAGGFGSISAGDTFDPRHVHGMLNDEYFRTLDKYYKLPAGTMQSEFMRESAGGTMLRSKAGALGPMQLMPKTAAELGVHGGEIFDLGISADAAARYLVRLRRMFGGDMNKAIVAYNWGPGNLQKHITDNAGKKLPWYAGLPKESANYIANWRTDTRQGPLMSNPQMAFNGYGASVARTPALATAPVPGASTVGGADNSTTLNIQSVTINTKATDAQGIKRGLVSLANSRAVNSMNTVVE